jgi:hypothetical protein
LQWGNFRILAWRGYLAWVVLTLSYPLYIF